MPLLVQCPFCKTRLGASAKKCETKSGKGCGKAIPHDRKVYYAQWRNPDGKVRMKKIGPHKKAAENFLNKMEVNIAEGRYIEKQEQAPRVLIRDFIDQHYMPWCQSYNRRPDQKAWYLKHIVREWGDKHLDELTDKDVDQFRWQMQKAKSETTFNRVLATLSHLFTIAIEYSFIERSPIKTAKKRFKERGRFRFLMPEEVQRLLDACSGHLRPIVLTALHTGMRKGEVFGLCLGINVDLQANRITLTKTKNDEVRHLPINDTLHGVLAGAAAGKAPGDPLFTNSNGVQLKTVRTAFMSACEAAGITDFHFHDLRHTFASNLVMNGVDLFVVKELLGHKDIKMTLKYAHLSPHHQQSAVKILDQVFAHQQPQQSYSSQKPSVSHYQSV